MKIRKIAATIALCVVMFSATAFADDGEIGSGGYTGCNPAVQTCPPPPCDPTKETCPEGGGSGSRMSSGGSLSDTLLNYFFEAVKYIP